MLLNGVYIEVPKDKLPLPMFSMEVSFNEDGELENDLKFSGNKLAEAGLSNEQIAECASIFVKVVNLLNILVEPADLTNFWEVMEQRGATVNYGGVQEDINA